MSTTVFQKWNPLRTYVSHMRYAVREWKDFFRTREVNWVSPEQIDAWMDRLLVSFDVIERLYVYDDIHSLHINRESSGFPSRRHFDSLVHTQTSLEIDEGALAHSKRLFLDSVFLNRRVSVGALEDVSKHSAYALLAKSEIHRPFQMLSIEERQSPTPNRKAYVCTWERFTDRPMHYVMVFEASVDWTPHGDSFSALVETLQNVSTHEISLERIARRIDISDIRIYPKWLGRIVLGPVWISHMTAGDHLLQHALDAVSSEVQQCASQVISEYVFSERESEISQVRDAQGNAHQYIQTFGVRPEVKHRERGVTFFEETLFAPHEIIQHLDDELHRTIGHKLIATER